MSVDQAEGVIKNIIREIAQECTMKGQQSSETLVAFMVKAVVLDPLNEFNVDRTLTKQDVRKLVELCVDRLLEKGSPGLDTIKMQVYFDMNYTSRREFIEEHQRVLAFRLSPMTREITDCRMKTQEEWFGLYRKIIGYVLLRSGLGSPSDVNIVKEATAALQSVFPQRELGTFMTLVRSDKERQLRELTMLVTGICLFNKYSQKGGEAISDLPLLLNEVILTTSEGIQLKTNQSQALAWKYTALLERLMTTEKLQTDYDLSPILLKQALYNVRQHEAFLKVILADVSLCGKQVDLLRSELASQLNLLGEMLQAKTVIPTAQVFPHFTALANIWSELQNEMVLLNILNDTAKHLQPFLEAQSELFSQAQLDDLLEGSEVKTDEQRMASYDCIDPMQFKTQEWFLPQTTGNFDKLTFQYKGICGYTLVEKDGLLLPGNPSIGVLKHQGKFYVFSSKAAALEFASRADEFIASVAEKAKSSPELIQLLELHQQFSYVTLYSKMQSGERLLVKSIAKCDSFTQTDTHPVEKHIDTSYEWNEWELRRKAIKLANLRTKVTRSGQTNMSHMRRENCSQTYLPRDATCQTKTDCATNMPKP